MATLGRDESVADRTTIASPKRLYAAKSSHSTARMALKKAVIGVGRTTSVTDLPTMMGIRTMTDDQSERIALLLSFQRALLGAVHQELRQASIEADRLTHRILVRFEYDGAPSEKAVESGQIATTAVIADFSAPWTIHEEHLEAPFPAPLRPLKLVAYMRAEDTQFQKQPRNLTE